MWKLFNHLAFTNVNFNSNSFELVLDKLQKKYFVNADKILIGLGFASNNNGQVRVINHLEKQLTIFPEISGEQRFISIKNINSLAVNSNGQRRSSDILVKLSGIVKTFSNAILQKKDFIKVDLSFNEKIKVLNYECQYTNHNGNISISLNDLAKSIGYNDGLSFKAEILDQFSFKSDTKYGPTRFISIKDFNKLSSFLLLRERRYSLNKAYIDIMSKLKLNDYFCIEDNNFIFNSFCIPFIVKDNNVLIHNYSFLNFLTMDSKEIHKPAAFKNAYLHDNGQYYVSLEEIELFYSSTKNELYKQRTLHFLSKRQRINYACIF